MAGGGGGCGGGGGAASGGEIKGKAEGRNSRELAKITHYDTREWKGEGSKRDEEEEELTSDSFSGCERKERSSTMYERPSCGVHVNRVHGH